jgi:KTSC domain-containing protein
MKLHGFFALLTSIFLAAFVAHAEPARNSTAIVSHIQRQPVQSSGLAAVGYSKRLHVLEIEFTNGAIYRYVEVPPSVHRFLMSAESKARFYDENVRGKYRSIHVRSQPKNSISN